MATVTVRARTTREAELRYTPSGKAIAELNLAENHRRKSQSGEWEDSGTTWWRGKAFGRAAEAIAEAVTDRGISLLLSGRSETEEWEKRDGSKGTTLVLLIDEWAVIPSQASQAARGRANTPGRGPAAGQSRANGQDGPWGTQAGNGPLRPVQDPWTADQFPAEPPF